MREGRACHIVSTQILVIYEDLKKTKEHLNLRSGIRKLRVLTVNTPFI